MSSQLICTSVSKAAATSGLGQKKIPNSEAAPEECRFWRKAGCTVGHWARHYVGDDNP